MSESRVVLVTSRSFGSGSVDLVGRLAQAGCSVVRAGASHDLDELAAILPRVAAWIAGTGPVTAQMLDLAPDLRIVARYGVGYDAVDLGAAAARDVVVTNTPGANSAAVADQALGLMLAVMRHIVAGDRGVRAHDWKVARGRELGSQVVGIVGFGRIGQLVARRVQGFGATVLVYDPWVDADRAYSLGCRKVETLEELLGDCDVVSLHLPGGTTVITSEMLAVAKPGLVLVNTARADLIDEQALVEALRTGRVWGFGADTIMGDVAATDSVLLAPELADHVVITPHSAAQTVEAVDQMGSMAVDNVLSVLGGTAPANPVKMP